MDVIYELDVLQSLSTLMDEKNLTLPIYSQEVKPIMDVSNCFHPFLDNPVVNSFTYKDGTNLCFITGPNMSGKSTFLKTVAVLIYFSHLGFPVPASRFETTLFQGLFTSINLLDSLNQGLSHFYSEVKISESEK